MNIRKNKIVWYLILAFGGSWSLAGIYYACGGRINATSPLSGLMLVVYMFFPMIAAIVVQKVIAREPVAALAVRFNLNRWYLAAWLLPALAALAAIPVALSFPGVHLSWNMAGMLDKFRDTLPPEKLAQLKNQLQQLPFHPIWIFLMQGLVAGATVNAAAAFGEELGWRGFLFREFRPLGFWKSSALIGFIWGLWHAPIIIQGYNYPQHPVVGVFMMIAWCMALSPIFCFIRLKAKSVIAAAVIHGTLNGTAGLAVMFLSGGNDLQIGLTGLAGFIVLAVINLAIFIGFRPTTAESNPQL